jgi:hypothetical protein
MKIGYLTDFICLVYREGRGDREISRKHEANMKINEDMKKFIGDWHE